MIPTVREWFVNELRGMKTSSLVILLLGILITLGSISWISFLALMAPALVPSYGGDEHIVLQHNEESLPLSLKYPLAGKMNADAPVRLYADNELLGEGLTVDFRLGGDARVIKIEGARGTSVHFVWSQEIPLSEYALPTGTMLTGIALVVSSSAHFVRLKKTV